ncbi:hypothetical protein RirG_123120 [Rhizophagus irregularis DAOM 197198w]|nr:hypothetical protein RirG_123120 [Rhizophagus irregularis DAOM 197198w]
MPNDRQKLVFAQLYIYNTDHENSNQLCIMCDLNAKILQNLQNMLDTYNLYIQNFRQIRDLFQNDADSAEIPFNRDIVLKLCNRTLQRISELHSSYNLLQYKKKNSFLYRSRPFFTQEILRFFLVKLLEK